jgi:maltokinase
MDDCLDPQALDQLLAAWMPHQRWFATKGLTTAQARTVAAVDLDPGSQGRPTIRLVEVDGVSYQVPLTGYRTEQPQLAAALVGVLPVEAGGCWVYDGPHDPAFVRPWLTVLAARAPGPATPALSLRGVTFAGPVRVPADALSRVLSGEQSNTSVIVGRQVIVKLFRVVAAGENPDVLVQTALAAAGCERVAYPVGAVEATAVDPVDGRTTRAHLAYACEFLPDSQDAWRAAVAAVQAGQPFVEQAHELGVATAQVHATLAQVMPRTTADPSAMAALADGLLARLDWACGQAEVLHPFRGAATRVLEAVRQVVDAPDLQQVHGDYHLGQVLHSATRGWVLLDFEGEPLRPLAERTTPDLALRDVAGMLRSFDYAAGHVSIARPDDDPAAAAARAWAAAARAAFVEGYRDGGGRDPDGDTVLLSALELDKALYEVVYEARNRPTWVPIPIAAVQRLLG